MFQLCTGHDLWIKEIKAMATKMIWQMTSHWPEKRLKKEFDVLSL